MILPFTIGGIAGTSQTARIRNHNQYIGEWKDDRANGQGTFRYSDGSKKVGQWKDNKYIEE